MELDLSPGRRFQELNSLFDTIPYQELSDLLNKFFRSQKHSQAQPAVSAQEVEQLKLELMSDSCINRSVGLLPTQRANMLAGRTTPKYIKTVVDSSESARSLRLYLNHVLKIEDKKSVALSIERDNLEKEQQRQKLVLGEVDLLEDSWKNSSQQPGMEPQEQKLIRHKDEKKSESMCEEEYDEDELEEEAVKPEENKEGIMPIDCNRIRGESPKEIGIRREPIVISQIWEELRKEESWDFMFEIRSAIREHHNKHSAQDHHRYHRVVQPVLKHPTYWFMAAIGDLLVWDRDQTRVFLVECKSLVKTRMSQKLCRVVRKLTQRNQVSFAAEALLTGFPKHFFMWQTQSGRKVPVLRSLTDLDKLHDWEVNQILESDSQINLPAGSTNRLPMIGSRAVLNRQNIETKTFRSWAQQCNIQMGLAGINHMFLNLDLEAKWLFSCLIVFEESQFRKISTAQADHAATLLTGLIGFEKWARDKMKNTPGDSQRTTTQTTTISTSGQPQPPSAYNLFHSFDPAAWDPAANPSQHTHFLEHHHVQPIPIQITPLVSETSHNLPTNSNPRTQPQTLAAPPTSANTSTSTFYSPVQTHQTHLQPQSHIQRPSQTQDSQTHLQPSSTYLHPSSSTQYLSPTSQPQTHYSAQPQLQHQQQRSPSQPQQPYISPSTHAQPSTSLTSMLTSLDPNQTGYIPTSSLGALISQAYLDAGISYPPTHEDIQSYADMLDYKKEGRISTVEFHTLIVRALSGSSSV